MKQIPTPAASSIVSYPERGPWGDPRYPGNSSGFVMLELLAALKPRFVVDVTAGSGTNVAVCRDYGVRVLGLDLKDGFNALRDSVLGRAGEHADLTWSHPPYWDVKRYSRHADDLSAAVDEDAFLDRLHALLLNQREATRPGGHYVTLLGLAGAFEQEPTVMSRLNSRGVNVLVLHRAGILPYISGGGLPVERVRCPLVHRR